MTFSAAIQGAREIIGRGILFVTPIDRAWYLDEHVATLFLGPATHCVPRPPHFDMFWAKDPTLEEALVGIDHRLYLELEGVCYLQSLILCLIDGATMDLIPATAVGVSFSGLYLY